MLLKHIRCFIAAAEGGSFTRAAERLYLTQSAVSQQIAALEKEAGAPLFYRKGRGIELTDSGRYLYREAKPLVAKLENALDKAATAATDKELRVTVYYRGEAVDPLVAPILDWMRRRNPLLSVSLLRSRRTSDTLSAIDSGEADIALLRKGAHPLAGSMEFHPICVSHLTCVFPEGHPLSERNLIALDDLENEPLVTLEHRDSSFSPRDSYDDMRYQWVHDKLRDRYPRQYRETADSVTAVTLVRAGFGCALVDSSHVPIGNGLAFVPYCENRFFEYGAFVSKHSANPAVGAFVDAIEALYPGMIMFGPNQRIRPVSDFLARHPGIRVAAPEPPSDTACSVPEGSPKAESKPGS